MTSSCGSTFPSACVSKPPSVLAEAGVNEAVIPACTCEILRDQLNASDMVRVYLLEASAVSPEKPRIHRDWNT
jgi:hypothetical protein